jgi:hypothetical protein
MAIGGPFGAAAMRLTVGMVLSRGTCCLVDKKYYQSIRYKMLAGESVLYIITGTV